MSVLSLWFLNFGVFRVKIRDQAYFILACKLLISENKGQLLLTRVYSQIYWP